MFKVARCWSTKVAVDCECSATCCGGRYSERKLRALTLTLQRILCVIVLIGEPLRSFGLGKACRTSASRRVYLGSPACWLTHLKLRKGCFPPDMGFPTIRPLSRIRVPTQPGL